MKTFADAQKIVEHFLEEHTQRSWGYRHTNVSEALKDVLKRLRAATVIEPIDVEQP